MDYELRRPGWTPAAAEYADGLAHVSTYPLSYLYGTWLTLSGFVIGRRAWVSFARSLYPNWYTCLVGPSAQGRKSTAITLGVDSVSDFLVAPPIRSVTTEQGLLQAMQMNGGPLLVELDELSTMLGKAKMDFGRTLPARLTELYDNPNSAGTYTLTNPITVQEPFLSFLAASTTEWLQETLTVTDMMAGLGNRLTFIVGDERPLKPWPGSPNNTLDWSILAMVDGEVLVVENAKDLWSEWYVKFDDRQRARAPLLRTLAQRLPEKVLKTALTHACWSGKPLIDERLMEQALDWGDYLNDCLVHLTPRFEHADRQVFAAIAAGKDTRRKIARALSPHVSTERVKRAIESLRWMGAISVDGDILPLVESLDEPETA